MDDRMQLYKVQVAATMEQCGEIVWQRMAHVPWPDQCIAGKNAREFGVIMLD